MTRALIALMDPVDVDADMDWIPDGYVFEAFALCMAMTTDSRFYVVLCTSYSLFVYFYILLALCL
ncbi:hypothetical protein BDN72DRAFT_847628 [Pluteus cervinus]|uniref:Uncharacterized protein n=1 Tax=Pluteus cervinus TaxID=181527 RepID=A0ACD3ACG6_9AGAR|nr:hypothetical protein BDN72DRAFT_847628 [Pluteus cervinus]